MPGEQISWRWVAGVLGGVLAALIGLAYQADRRITTAQDQRNAALFDDVYKRLDAMQSRITESERHLTQHELTTILENARAIDQLRQRIRVLEKQSLPRQWQLQQDEEP